MLDIQSLLVLQFLLSMTVIVIIALILQKSQGVKNMVKEKAWDTCVDNLKVFLYDLWERDKDRYEHVMAFLTALLENCNTN